MQESSFWPCTVIQEESCPPRKREKNKRTKDVKGSSKSKKSQKSSAKVSCMCIGNVSDKMYAHPTRIKHKSKDVSVCGGLVQRKDKEQSKSKKKHKRRQQQQRPWTCCCKIFNALIRCADILLYFYKNPFVR
jgi:hypothetical protein